VKNSVVNESSKHNFFILPGKIYFPESRLKELTAQENSLSETERKKFSFAVTELRKGTRPNDHKLKKLPTDAVWVTDLGGRKGGRIIYLKKGKDFIIWGLSSDHQIEFDAANCFSNSTKEDEILNAKLDDHTHRFLTEAEEENIRKRSVIFTGNISDEILRKFGLSDYQIKGKSDRVSLWDLYIPDKIKFKIMLLAQAPEGTVFSVQNDTHLEKFIKGDVERLLVHLDDYQNEIIEYNTDKPLLIKGETGTGKTTILIYKAVYYAEDNPEKDVILFTYNIALANLITEAIAQLNDTKLANLRVYGFLEWVKEALFVYEEPFELIEERKDNKLYDLLGECYDEKDMKQLGYSKKRQCNSFLRAEIEKIIQDYDLREIDDYLKFRRIGKKKQLGERQRETIWEIYNRFLEKLKEKGLDTYKTMLRKFSDIQKVKSIDEKLCFDAIFLDEAQDMPPSIIKALALLRKDERSLTWIAGDYKQSIYRNSFRWSDVQLPFYGVNVKVLKKNYRNSQQILEAAHQMLSNFIEDAERPDHCGRQGVAIQKYKYSKGEKFLKLKGIIDYFHEEENVDLSDIAVFTPYKPEKIQKELTALSVPCEMIKFSFKEDADRVKVATLYSAKGLEFRVVIILDTQTKLLFEYQYNDILEVQKAAKLLYVGMTRAYDVCCFLLNEERELGKIVDKVLNHLEKLN